MEFFGLGFGEILLIIVIALIIFGPEKIPEIARMLGRTVRTFRQVTSGFTTAVTRELEEEDKSHEPRPKATSDVKPKVQADSAESGNTEIAGQGNQRNINGRDE